MIDIADARATSTAAPAAFFARWADVPTWPHWDDGIAWVRLDGPFGTGATGQLKPKGGPKVRFVVSVLTDVEFTDVSRLPGARLVFRHLIDEEADGRTRVRVSVGIAGPLAPLWRLIVGRGIQAGLQHTLDSLVAAAEKSAVR